MRRIHKLFFANFAVYLLALLLLVICSCPPVWMSRGDTHMWGIFQKCSRGDENSDWDCEFTGLPWKDVEKRFRVNVFLIYCALVASAATGVTQMLRFMPLCCVFEIYAGFYIVMCADSYRGAIKGTEQLAWGFYIALLSGVIFVCNGIALVVLVKNSNGGFDHSPCSNKKRDEKDEDKIPGYEVDFNA